MAAALSRAITQGRMAGCPEKRSVNWLDSETQKRLCRQSQELLQRAQSRAVNWSSLVEDRGEVKPISLNTSFKTMAEYMDYVSSQCGRFHSLVPEKAALNHVCRYHRNQLNPMSSSRVRQKKPTSHDPRESYQVTKTGPIPFKFDPESSKFNQVPSNLDPGPSRLDSGPSKLDPGPSRLDPGPSKFDPGPTRLDSGPSKSDPGPSRLDLGPSKFDTGPYKFGPRPSKFVDRAHSEDITIEVSPGTYTITVGSPSVTTTRMIEVDSGQIIHLNFPL